MLLVQCIVSSLQAKMYRKGDIMVKHGQNITELMFIYVGVAHLQGTSKWNDETFLHRCVKLKKGSWFGDYQILTNTPSEWDLIAGGDHEFNISKRPKGMARDHILCYDIASEHLLEILDRYPEFRSFMLTRALVRRYYFNKVKADNLQVILFRRKQEQRSQVVEALGIENEFLIGEMAEELEKMQNDDQDK